MDPITLIGSWLATFSFQEFILGRCKEHLEEAPEKGALALLKRFSEKRNVGSLPQNHDLELAGHEALKEATRALLLGIHAQLDPKPPLFEAIRNHLQNGTLTTQPLIELRSSRSREWFNAFQKLCDDETSFARLTRKAEPLESNPVAKFGGHVDESAERELHQRFSEWLDHEMQNTPGRPDFIDDFLHKGWPVEKDGRERVALYQAWCLFFREKLKHKPEVFRILVIDTLTEVAANVKELSALAIQQPSINDFHTWIGLRLGALQAWLKGEFDRVHDKLDDHGQLLYAIKEQTANPPRAIPKGKPNNLSFGSIGSLFKGRDADLEKIHAHLQTKRPLVIYGLGGVGKTRLTIEYALKHSEEYSALLSVGASSPDVLYRNLAALYAVLALPEPAPIEQDVQCQAVLHWLNDHPGWLLLLDNADSKHAADAVETVLPRLRAGNVIVTSRISQWSKAVDTLPLEELLPSAATEFLLDATKGKRVISATDNADAATLASDLGYLALALEQATAYVETKRISLATYRARWQEREANVRSWFDPRSMQYPKSIVFAWDATFEQLSPTAQSLLRMLCWLAPDAIPRSLLETEEANKILADLVPETTNHHNAMEDALAELAGFSLLKWDYDSTSFRIHRLVQEVTQDQIESAHRTVYIGAALNTLNNARPSDPPPNDVRSWPIWEPLRLHVEAVVRVADVAQIAEPTSYLMNELGILLYTKCVWGQAEALHRRALAIDEARFGAENPNVAIRLNNLALLLHDTNRLAEAEPPMRRALAIDEAGFGAENPVVAIRLNNLAQLLQATNRLTEAEPLTRRALAIDEASFGTEHPNVAIRLNNLAMLLRNTNRLTEAEPLMRRALAIDEARFGAEHPNVAIRLNNLALLLLDTNRLTEAEPLIRRALAIDEASFGGEHPSFAIRLSNLAALLKVTNRPNEAEPLMRRALAIDEASYGAEHPTVAICLNNLAILMIATNRLNEAEPLMRCAVEILLRFKQLTGHSHPNLAAYAKDYRAMLYLLEFTPEQIQTRLHEIAVRFELGASDSAA